MGRKSKMQFSLLIGALVVGNLAADAGVTEKPPGLSKEAAVQSNTVDTLPDPLLGKRADWLRGSWGINWKPVNLYNGRSESLTIDHFLDQISGLKTLDYLQLHLGDSHKNSPVHLGSHDLLESLWQGDTDARGRPINLVVPRKSAGVDPFLEMLKATKAVGLKTQVYVNSANMLKFIAQAPSAFPNITQRWKAWCDTDPEAQAFIASQSYHTHARYPNRKYMFCYAEFVLKDYAIRYGDLIDSWLFDAGHQFMGRNGDNPTSGVEADQRIYQAFAQACRAGNPNAAVCFNNGPERDTEALNPFSEATLYDDYMFGHPYAPRVSLGDHASRTYERNYAHIQKITETGGNVHAGGAWTWDDKVVGHFDPPMSSTRWNTGATPGLTDEEFLLWNLESARGGGAISWGAPLVRPEGEGNELLIRDWGMAQLTLMDNHLSVHQSPGAPNWARAETPLPDASFGQAYSRVLVEGVDFWDPEGDTVTLSLMDAPAWLRLKQDSAHPGCWLLQGLPTETSPAEYKFRLRAKDASGATERWVELKVGQPASPKPSKGSAEVQTTYYVSPSGNDRNAGTEASPFKTIEKARDAVRKINQNMTGDIVVYIGGGEYPMNSTILFDETDSGTNGHYVTYRAKPGETPLLTGGMKVTGWKPVSGTSLYQASVTSVDNFRQMYVNGSRAQRAVSSSTYKGKAWHYNRSGSEDGLILNLSPVPSYGNPGDMELVQVSNWSFHRVPVNSFAAAGAGETAIVMENPYFAWSRRSTGHNRFSFNKPFYIENAYELLDTPGEWYLNRSTDTLYYWPLSGEDMARAEVIIPKTETLIKMRGASLTEKVENIRFDGLTFAHTTELRPSTEGAFSQQASKWSGGDGAFAMKESTDYRPKATVYLEATDGIRFENNVFEHLGGAGLDALNGVSHTLIERNVYRDISDSAIAVGDWCHNYLNTGNACFRMNLSFPNGSIEAQLKRVSEYDGQTEMGLAHFTNSGNYVKFYHQNNQWKIAKVIAGVTTVIGTGPSYPVADNTDYTVKFVVKDSFVEGFVNGVSQCSISDSGLGDVDSPRQVALVADNARVRFDNVQMVNTDNGTVVREDFENGAFPDWFNIGRKWDLVTDGTTRMQFDDFGVIDEEVCAQNWIKNNTIEQTAREYWGACAISGYITDGLVIDNNRIHDTKYSGITLGFGHGFYPDSTTCVNNVVRYNDISHFNYQCYDGGAVYTTGQMPKSLIEYNYFHDSLSSHPLRGIQCDNGSGVIEMRYNVIENVKYPNGRDQRCIQFTQRLCYDLWAHDNYTNSTEQRQNGGPDCRITDTTVYTVANRPAIAYAIASKTGVAVPAIVSEDFEGGADAWSNKGGRWSVISMGDHEYQVDNNEGTQYSCTDGRTVNVSVEAKIKLDKTYAADGAIGVVARYADSDNVYRFFHNKDSWKLLKKVGGTASILGAGPNTTLAPGTEVDVKLVVNGSSLEGYVNGVLQCRVTDTDLVSGKSGLYSFKSKGSFDDVVIRVIDSPVPNLP